MTESPSAADLDERDSHAWSQAQARELRRFARTRPERAARPCPISPRRSPTWGRSNANALRSWSATHPRAPAPARAFTRAAIRDRTGSARSQSSATTSAIVSRERSGATSSGVFHRSTRMHDRSPNGRWAGTAKGLPPTVCRRPAPTRWSRCWRIGGRRIGRGARAGQPRAAAHCVGSVSWNETSQSMASSQGSSTARSNSPVPVAPSYAPVPEITW